MDRTIHNCSYVDVAGGRGGSPGVASDCHGDGGGGDGGTFTKLCACVFGCVSELEDHLRGGGLNSNLAKDMK